MSFLLLLFVSVTDATFVTSILPADSVVTIVGSSTTLPSVSSPSSEVSVTLLVCPGDEAVAETMLLISPVFAAFWLMVYVAVYEAISPTVSVP